MATHGACDAQSSFYVTVTAMADWQRRVWEDIVAVEGVVPSAGSCVLVVGDGLPVVFEDDVRVVRRAWGEAMGDEAGFDRIVILAAGNVRADFVLVLSQMWRLLRPDGLLVLITARQSPWGIRRTIWWRGYPWVRWRRWLRRANWLVAEVFTVGFCAAWARWVPWGGPIRVVLAQKRVGGTRVLAHDGRGGMIAKPAGIPV